MRDRDRSAIIFFSNRHSLLFWFWQADRPSFPFASLQQRHYIFLGIFICFCKSVDVMDFVSIACLNRIAKFIFRVQAKANVRMAYWLMSMRWYRLHFACPHRMHRERAPSAHIQSISNHIWSKSVSDGVLWIRIGSTNIIKSNIFLSWWLLFSCSELSSANVIEQTTKEPTAHTTGQTKASLFVCEPARFATMLFRVLMQKGEKITITFTPHNHRRRVLGAAPLWLCPVTNTFMIQSHVGLWCLAGFMLFFVCEILNRFTFAFHCHFVLLLFVFIVDFECRIIRHENGADNNNNNNRNVRHSERPANANANKRNKNDF